MTDGAPGRILIVGCGKRVLDAALPALRQVTERWSLAGLFARSAREIETGGHTYAVRALEGLTADDLSGVDLVHLAVAKDAVPAVLERLGRFEVGGIDLLIDTPVVRFKHFRHLGRLKAWRRVWVAEDCVAMPWLETVALAVEEGLIGRPMKVLFDRSAYAYHGVATAKALLGVRRVVSGRRKALGGGQSGHERTLRFPGGKRCVVIEPRDYSVGKVTLFGTGGSISDSGDGVKHQLLRPVIEEGMVRGFEIGRVATRLAPHECELTRGDGGEMGVIPHQEAMKRVGFLRLLEGIADGRGAYPLADALDDMVVDYHLEKLGRYLANPFTSPRSPLARGLLSVLTRLGG